MPKVPYRRSVLLIFAILSLFSASCSSKAKKDPANTVRLSSPSKIKGLDPALADDYYSGTESSRTYEGLLQYHYLKRPYELIPQLAAGLPSVGTDGKTYIFKLKKGVLFQDDPCFVESQGKGRELTAEDFVYSFKRLADPHLNSTGWWLFDGKIVGLNEWHDLAIKAGANYTLAVEGLKALDRYTLQITLKEKSAQFLYSLAMPFTGVVAKEAVETYGKEFINHPVGTGPFHLAEYNPNSKLVWVKNPTYRRETYPSEGEPSDQAKGLLKDAGKLLPLADQLVVQVFEESQPMWLTFLAGKLDLAGIPKDNYQQAVTASKDLSPELVAKGIVLSKSAEADITHYSFNMADPILGKNKFLRQAMNLAFDEAASIDLFFNGRAIPAQGPIPPGLSGYDPNLKNPFRQLNLAKAKELMVKAGYPEGRGLQTLEYVTLSDSTARQMTEYAQKMFGAIGIKLKVNTYSWPEFQSAIRNKRGQLWSFAWSADYPDGENFLQLFYSKNISPGPNDANYVNPDFDRLYEKSLALVDSPERTALYQKMVNLVIEDCPWIFGVHRIQFGLAQPWLRNYKRHAFDHGSSKYLRIETELKK